MEENALQLPGDVDFGQFSKTSSIRILMAASRKPQSLPCLHMVVSQNNRGTPKYYNHYTPGFGKPQVPRLPDLVDCHTWIPNF